MCRMITTMSRWWCRSSLVATTMMSIEIVMIITSLSIRVTLPIAIFLFLVTSLLSKRGSRCLLLLNGSPRSILRTVLMMTDTRARWLTILRTNLSHTSTLISMRFRLVTRRSLLIFLIWWVQASAIHRSVRDHRRNGPLRDDLESARRWLQIYLLIRLYRDDGIRLRIFQALISRRDIFHAMSRWCRIFAWEYCHYCWQVSISASLCLILLLTWIIRGILLQILIVAARLWQFLMRFLVRRRSGTSLLIRVCLVSLTARWRHTRCAMRSGWMRLLLFRNSGRRLLSLLRKLLLFGRMIILLWAMRCRRSSRALRTLLFRWVLILLLLYGQVMRNMRR